MTETTAQKNGPQQREEIASDYYYGGMVVERTAQVHPALYYGGLLKAASRAGARLCANWFC